MNLLLAHPAITTIAAYWVFSAVIGGMPAPDTNSGRGYLWAYNSLHLLAGNVKEAFAARYGQPKP